MAPTVSVLNEIYNGIQTGVIEVGDNQAIGVEQASLRKDYPEKRSGRRLIASRVRIRLGPTA